MGCEMGRRMSVLYDIQRLGNEAEPLVIIDDFSEQFEALRQTAEASTYTVTGPHYPGIRAQADPSYLGPQMAVLKDVLTKVFGYASGANLIECAYSLVTTPPLKLTPIQRLPHFDSTDPKRLALLHYFGDASSGGTAFYRHVSTGFETISQARHQAYTAALQAEINKNGLPPAAYYAAGPLYERIGEVEAKPNRMVLYRGYRLHSGIIPTDVTLSTDPKQGRLTLNTFLQAR